MKTNNEDSPDQKTNWKTTTNKINETLNQIIEDFAECVIKVRIHEIYEILRSVDMFITIVDTDNTTFGKIIDEVLDANSTSARILKGLNEIFYGDDLEVLEASWVFKDALNGKICKKPENREEALNLIGDIRIVLLGHYIRIINECAVKDGINIRILEDDGYFQFFVDQKSEEQIQELSENYISNKQSNNQKNNDGDDKKQLDLQRGDKTQSDLNDNIESFKTNFDTLNIKDVNSSNSKKKELSDDIINVASDKILDDKSNENDDSKKEFDSELSNKIEHNNNFESLNNNQEEVKIDDKEKDIMGGDGNKSE